MIGGVISEVRLRLLSSTAFSIHCLSTLVYVKGAQIPGARSPERLNFVRWRRIFGGLQYGTRFLSPFWFLEFLGGPRFLEKLRTPSLSQSLLDAVIKRPEREANRPSPSNADLRNEWTYTSS